MVRHFKSGKAAHHGHIGEGRLGIDRPGGSAERVRLRRSPRRGWLRCGYCRAPASAAASAAGLQGAVAIEHVPDIDRQSCHAEKSHEHDRDEGQHLPGLFLVEPSGKLAGRRVRVIGSIPSSAPAENSGGIVGPVDSQAAGVSHGHTRRCLPAPGFAAAPVVLLPLLHEVPV